ncbi:hypothetical protein [Acinetobacter sp.]|uniref:hypothetical protein n=1 Tax=Acinetobacter sp. TaxID=472 RepID=UPI00388D5AF1
MKLQEIIQRSTLLEGKCLEVYDTLLPLLLLKEEDGGDSGGGSTDPGEVGGGVVDAQPVDSPTTRNDAGWDRGPFNHVGNGPGRWFIELYNSVKQLIVANNVMKRMKELGISNDGSSRVKKAAQQAAANVNSLLSNPRATTARIPVWTFDKPKAPKIKRWNEAFAYEFKAELAKLTEEQIL